MPEGRDVGVLVIIARDGLELDRPAHKGAVAAALQCDLTHFTYVLKWAIVHSLRRSANAGIYHKAVVQVVRQKKGGVVAILPVLKAQQYDNARLNERRKLERRIGAGNGWDWVR